MSAVDPLGGEVVDPALLREPAPTVLEECSVPVDPSLFVVPSTPVRRRPQQYLCEQSLRQNERIFKRGSSSSDTDASTFSGVASDGDSVAETVSRISQLSGADSVRVQGVRSVVSDCSSVGTAFSLGEKSPMSLQHVRPKRAYTYKTRRKGHAIPRDKRRRHLLSPAGIDECMSFVCCPDKCLRSLDCDEVEYYRNKFTPMSRTELNRSVIALIKRGRAKGRAGAHYIYRTDDDTPLCAKAVCKLFGISSRQFDRCIVAMKSNREDIFATPTSTDNGYWKQYVVPYIADVAERFGNKMPDTNKIEIGVGTKLQLYMRFKALYEANPGERPEAPNLSWFYRLWMRFCSHVEVPKRSRFTKCTTCTTFKARLEGVASPAMKQRWVIKFDEHLEHQMLERKQYYKNRHHARSYPNEAMSMIIDGMAQGITNLPFFPKNKPKSLFGKPKYDLHVMGTLVHGKAPLVLIHDSRMPTGPNLTIECMYRALALHVGERLPPLLYVQLDNTSSDNKNHHVIEACASLVEQGYFEEVRLS